MKRSFFVTMVLLTLLVAGPASAGHGVVAVQACEPSCRDASGDRFVNCNNGTLTDNLTGLVWLANPVCLGRQGPGPQGNLLSWYDAVDVVGNLSDMPDALCDALGLTYDVCDCELTDGSSPGEWRLPTAAEFTVLITSACSYGLTDDSGGGCWSYDCAAAGNCSFQQMSFENWHWTATTWPPDPTKAIGFDWFNFVQLATDDKSTEGYIWAVRGGQ